MTNPEITDRLQELEHRSLALCLAVEGLAAYRGELDVNDKAILVLAVDLSSEIERLGKECRI